MNLKRIIMASIIAGGVAVLPMSEIINDATEMKIIRVAQAQVETYIGIGDYVISDDVPPGDIKSKAKLYAERNALEKSGVFINSLTEVKNGKVTKDEIMAITGNILKIVNVKEQNNSLQKLVEEQAKRIAQLEKNAANIKTAEDRQKITEEIKEIDKNTLAIQKLEEGLRLYNEKNFFRSNYKIQ